MIISGIIKKLMPDLELSLRRSGRKDTVDEYIARYEKIPLLFGGLLSALAAIVLLDGVLNRGWPAPSLILILPACFFFLISSEMIFFSLPKISSVNRKYELESDLLYSTRFLLLKLESGSPLLNSLIDVSNLHTKSSKFFGEIVSEIYMGTPLEEAIDLGMKYTTSKAFAKILEEIKNSLKTGADIEKSLKSTLESLTKEHLIEIKAYGRKLSPLSMMYMIIGTIVPSLGSALIVVATGFIELPIQTTSALLIVLIIGLVIIQVFFILFFKALKPQVMS